MHIEIKKEVLIKKLSLVARIAAKHLTLPVLQCVRIEAVAGKITFTGTNLELGMTLLVEGTVHEDGVIAVPGALLLQTVELIQDGIVSLKMESDVLVVVSRGSRTKINTFSVGEFPTIPLLEGKAQRINAKTFALGIRTVSFATSQSTIKPELGSVAIQQHKEHSLTFIATDSFRLIEKTVSQEQLTLESPLLIPQKNALEIARVLELMEEGPECIIGEGQMAFRFNDGTYLTTRLTEGSFPDYTQIIPKEYVTHVTVLTADLEHALKMTNVFTNKFMQVGFEIQGAEKALVLSSDSGESGAATEQIAAVIEGEDLKLSFNQRYVSDPLSHMPGESIVLHFAGIGRPMVMEDVREKHIRYLVMPMNK